MPEYIEFNGIGKAYPGVQALKDISFRAGAGKVLALLGENGAGKSTLLKILSGDIQPDEGTIIIDGEEQKFAAPYHAISRGISVIYQDRQLVPGLNVIENIYSGDLPSTRLGLLRKDEMRRTTREIIDAFGLPIDPEELVGGLSVAYQQMVEIMKAYRRDSQIIAFDEPTAPLTDAEISILFRLIRKLRDDGKIVIYVSHRLAEIFQITDEIVVLKDGRLVKTMATPETDEAELIKAMVGRDIGDTYSRLSRNDKLGDVLLEVNNLVTDAVHDVSFTLRKGEIAGFAGLVGAGRTEVVRALFGADHILSGEIKINGKIHKAGSEKASIEQGIALCPEDRKEQGLIMWRSITDNICLPVLDKLKKLLFLDRKKSETLAEKAVERYSIKTPTLDKIVSELSGGNQQKVILGRWTSDLIDTKILILDEPTKGIDVGTKAEVYQMVCDFAKQGIGVIFISSELTEVINVADTIIVMHNGHITGTVKREDATEENVLALAMLD
ncbi:MAG: sugar ABC transporter ATP-binding protein [Oscillospiraceae bacterium]|jgi:ABC-type sugar transport system ATPase subunit|nr:sugar ABC transporter ATP-binding protein [Oscillospiraceae bacterium]